MIKSQWHLICSMSGCVQGGSWVTTGVEMSPYTRYGFRRHFFQHSGFRLVRSQPQNRKGRIYIPAKPVSTPLYIEGDGWQGRVKSTSNFPLQWRHNERDGVSNYQRIDSLFHRLFMDRKHQNSASLAFVGGIHRWRVNSPHKGPVTRKVFPFDDVIILSRNAQVLHFGQTLWCLIHWGRVTHICVGNLTIIG